MGSVDAALHDLVSFPAACPLARIGQVMARSATVGHIRTLPPTGSDHLPVAARITLAEGMVPVPTSLPR